MVQKQKILSYARFKKLKTNFIINNYTSYYLMKSLLLFFASIATFLVPINGLLILMVLFIIFDTAFGIYTTIKLNGVQSFKSTKLFNVVVKSFFYLFSIIMAFFIDKYVFEGAILSVPYLAAKTMTIIWIYIEVKSLDETSMKLGNKSFWVILKEMTTKLSQIKKDLN